MMIYLNEITIVSQLVEFYNIHNMFLKYYIEYLYHTPCDPQNIIQNIYIIYNIIRKILYRISILHTTPKILYILLYAVHTKAIIAKATIYI